MSVALRLKSASLPMVFALIFIALLTPSRAADFILGVSGPGLDSSGVLQELGWAWARVPLRWSDAVNGGAEDWSSAERQIAAAQSAGMRVQLTISFGWPRTTRAPFAIDPATGLPADETGRSAMQSFLQDTFNRFGGRIDAIGVEDDLSAHAFPGGPKVYAQLLQYVSVSAKSIQPDIAVVLGALNFNSMEEDQRVFYVSDAIRHLGTTGVFDAVELRVPALNSTSDYRRLTGAYSHIAGQLEGTPYQNARLLLLTDSPSLSGREQASDLVRRAILSASLGFSGFYWDGLSDRDQRKTGLIDAQAGYRRLALTSANAVGRMTGKFYLDKTQIIPRGRSLYQLELVYRTGGTTTLVWRDFFVTGQSYDSWENIDLKTVEIEGPHRVGLMSLPLVPDDSGTLNGGAVYAKNVDIGGAPTLLSKNYELMRGLGAYVVRPATETPAPAAAPEPAEVAPQDLAPEPYVAPVPPR